MSCLASLLAADTIIGANHKGVVMSHVERTSKYTKLAKLPDKNADFVVQACARVLLPLADQIETITLAYPVITHTHNM